MATILPSKHFEGSGLGPIDRLKESIAKEDWPKLTKKQRASAAQRLMGFSAWNGIGLETALSLVSAAVATACATYSEGFYTSAYNYSLAHAQKENEKNI